MRRSHYNGFAIGTRRIIAGNDFIYFPKIISESQGDEACTPRVNSPGFNPQTANKLAPPNRASCQVPSCGYAPETAQSRIQVISPPPPPLRPPRVEKQGILSSAQSRVRFRNPVAHRKSVIRRPPRLGQGQPITPPVAIGNRRHLVPESQPRRAEMTFWLDEQPVERTGVSRVASRREKFRSSSGSFASKRDRTCEKYRDGNGMARCLNRRGSIETVSSRRGTP